MTLTSHRIIPRFLRGFSLPEVTISIGIAALGLTSVVGFLPQGLDAMRKAGNISTETRITQQILASVASAEWVDAQGADLLTDEFQGKRFYFDDLAVELEGNRPSADMTYVAEVQIPQQDISLPTGSSSSSTTVDPYLRRVVVKVGITASRDYDFDSAPATTYRTYATVVSRSGR